MNKDTYRLLELAAKAANHTKTLGIYYDKKDDTFYSLDGPWNPLANNADAFCLAVTLYLEIRPYINVITVAGDGVWEEIYSDKYSREENTRLAIVQAAAEIANKLP